jgi:hypothetical protein
MQREKTQLTEIPPSEVQNSFMPRVPTRATPTSSSRCAPEQPHPQTSVLLSLPAPVTDVQADAAKRPFLPAGNPLRNSHFYRTECPLQRRFYLTIAY